MAALSTMMGAVVLARVAGTGDLSDNLLAAGREAVLSHAATAGAVKPPAKTPARRKAVAKR